MKVIANLGISLDGKIADRKKPSKFWGSYQSKKLMKDFWKSADAIIFGANTLKSHPFVRKIPGKNVQPVNIVITKSGGLPRDIPFWKDDSVVRFVFTTKTGLQKAEQASKERAFIEVCGENSVDPTLIIERLKKSGIKNILVEGGGEIMSLFLRSQLLDELFITVTPYLIGGNQNPSLVGGEGLLPWTSLKLKKTIRKKDEIYSHYLVRKQKNNGVS